MTKEKRKPKFKMPMLANDWGGQDAIEAQRVRAQKIAKAIFQGGQIAEEDRALVAHALVRWASSLPKEPDRPRGRPPKYNAPVAAQDFVRLRHQGMKHTDALLEVARIHGIEANDTDTLQKKVWDKLRPYIDKP